MSVDLRGDAAVVRPASGPKSVAIVPALGMTMVFGVIGVLAVAGCGDATSSAGGVQVVATTTVLGDVVRNIVDCAGGQSTTLMPVGADPHEFAPSSSDVTAMVKADLVVANGLGLEEGLADALTGAAQDGAKIFEVAPRLDPIPFGDTHVEKQHAEEGHGADEHGADEHAAGSADPHVWHDPVRMARAAKAIAAELGEVTGDSDTFTRCGGRVADDLAGVDARVREILAVVPKERRVLITDHHAFGYFAAAYGFEVAGVVIPGGSSLAAPSSAEVADLVKVIKVENVPVIFSTATGSSRLVDAVAKEVGTRIQVVPLYVGSLGEPGSGAESYRTMMTSNATRIARALAG